MAKRKRRIHRSEQKAEIWRRYLFDKARCRTCAASTLQPSVLYGRQKQLVDNRPVALEATMLATSFRYALQPA